jgi:hypothetical protein
MVSRPCTITDCPWLAWDVCERCQRPFCRLHARWHPYEVVRDTRATTVIYEFVCFDCVPRTDDVEDDPPVRETGTGDARRYRLCEAV